MRGQRPAPRAEKFRYKNRYRRRRKNDSELLHELRLLRHDFALFFTKCLQYWWPTPFRARHTVPLRRPASDMLWPLLTIHVHVSAIGKTRSRPRPHGSRSLEHERDGGDWSLHRDSAGDSGDGRATV